MSWFSPPSRPARRGRRPASALRRSPGCEPLEPRRLMAAGAPDSTFGTGGVATFNVLGQGVNEIGRDVAIQPDGKVVIVGEAERTALGQTDFAAARLNADGSLDTGFGNQGRVVFDFGVAGAGDVANAVAIQPDGKIVIVGLANRTGSGGDFGVARLNADGSFDTGFGGGGRVVIGFGAANLDDVAHGVAIQPDGRIVVGGYARTAAGDTDFAAARLNANGSLDTGFGTGGRVVIGFAGGLSDSAGDLAIQPDGRIILAGVAGRNVNTGAGGDFAAARLDANGSLDGGFGAGGRTTFDFGVAGAGEVIHAVALLPDGRIVVGGSAERAAGSDADFAVARLNANGSLDPGFGAGGRTTLGFGASGADEEIRDLAVQPDGKVVAVGFAERVPGSDTDFAAARLNADGSLDGGFGTGGRTTFGILPGRFENAIGVGVQNNGAIVLAGSAGDAGNFSHFAAVRLEGDAGGGSGSGSGSGSGNGGGGNGGGGPVAPRVVGFRAALVRQRRRRGLEMVLSLSGPLGAGANNVGSYRLITAGRDRRFGTRDDRTLALGSAAFDPATNAVTIRPRARNVRLNQPLRLTAFAASLASPAGVALDGDGNGTPGGDYVTAFGRPARPAAVRGGGRRG